MFKTFHRQRAACAVADFAETDVLQGAFDAEEPGFAPTQIFAMDRTPATGLVSNAPILRDGFAANLAPRSADEDWMPSSWATLRWVEEQEAAARQTAQRLRGEHAAQVARGAADVDADADADSARGTARRRWLQRFEDALDRLLPGNLGSLLQLFICVSLSMALISAFLPLVDRI